MPTSIEHNGYVIEVDADWWCVDVFTGKYTITEKASGMLVRQVGQVLYRPSPEAARSAAVMAGLHYVDQALIRNVT